MDTLSWILLLSGIGIANTMYLSYHALTGRPVACIGLPAEWCRKVQYSSWSKTFGIPNAYAGLVMYTAIFVLLWLGGYTLDDSSLRWLIYIGFAFSMYFTFVQAFILKAFCTWCVVSAVDFTLMFLILKGYLFS